MELEELKRAKKRWQMALRRYIIEQLPSEQYAFYFGLDCELFRKWIEAQFAPGLNWGNFGKNWQFNHVIPVSYFNLNDEIDLKLCWNFINIRVENLQFENSKGNKIDVIACKTHFQNLFTITQFSLCQKMIDKIESIEASFSSTNSAIEQFIISNKETLETIITLNESEFYKLNEGTSLQDVLLEKEMLRRFGG